VQHPDAFMSSVVHGTRKHGLYLAMTSNHIRRNWRLFTTNFSYLHACQSLAWFSFVRTPQRMAFSLE